MLYLLCNFKNSLGGTEIKRVIIILAVVLAIFFIIVGIVATKHWDNIIALRTAKTTSTEEIISKAETSKQTQQETLEKHGVYVKPPTLDEMDGLINGSISLDDFKSKIDNEVANADNQSDESIEVQNGILEVVNNSFENVHDASNHPESKPSPQLSPSHIDKEQKPDSQEQQKPVTEEQPKPVTQEEPKPTAQELIDAAVKELYAYEAELLVKLGELKKEALADYYSRGATHDNLIAIGMEGLDKCYVLESDADAKVKGVLDKLKKDLESIGEDTAITKELWEYYCDEKDNTKTYYINKYL